MNKFTVELTEEQLQRALIVLGGAAYTDIADIIDTIKHQVNEQIKDTTQGK